MIHSFNFAVPGRHADFLIECVCSVLLCMILVEQRDNAAWTFPRTHAYTEYSSTEYWSSMVNGII